jgi:hydroxymethylbilane synthase
VQANEIVEALRKVDKKIRYDVMPIRTEGDKENPQVKQTQRKGLFTKEIEESLIRGDIDIAVHSMKDLTTNTSPSLVVIVPERLDPRDVLVARQNRKFSDLPTGAKIGTSSLRRRAQLLAARADLNVVDVRGNVNTRLRKLTDGEFDGLVLAAAGLKRLGLAKQVSEVLPTDLILPAVGQGALAIQCVEGDEGIKELLTKIQHQPSLRAVLAERAFARRLGADCQTPIAAYARDLPSRFVIEGLVASPNGRMILRSRIASHNADSEEVGQELAEKLLN